MITFFLSANIGIEHPAAAPKLGFLPCRSWRRVSIARDGLVHEVHMELDEAAALFEESARRSERCTERLLLLCRAFNEARRAIAQRRRRRSSERCCKAFLVHLAQKCIRLLRELREFLQQGFKGFRVLADALSRCALLERLLELCNGARDLAAAEELCLQKGGGMRRHCVTP